MNDTPETDDQPLIYAMNDNGYQVPCVELEFARRLKRDRNEAMEDLEFRRGLYKVQEQCLETARRERDEAREQLRKASVEANTLATSIQKAEYSDAKEFELLGSVAGVISQIDNMYAGVRQQRDEAREQIKELIYISERAIALAEIDFENDKFGVVSELRDGVERIKEGAK